MIIVCNELGINNFHVSRCSIYAMHVDAFTNCILKSSLVFSKEVMAIRNFIGFGLSSSVSV